MKIMATQRKVRQENSPIVIHAGRCMEPINPLNESGNQLLFTEKAVI